MAFIPGKKTKKAAHGGVIAALDVGSTKICCLIARADDPNKIKVIGVGHQSSQGVRAGTIVNMEDAEAAIGNAVHAAEQMAGVTIRDVYVNVSGGHPTSQTLGVEVAILDQEVTEVDLRRALAQGRAQHRIPENEVIHAIPVSYSLDGNRGIRDPRGMFGDRLGVALHIVTAHSGPLRNLHTCVGRCHLDIEGMAVSPYASGLSCLVEDELDLGVTCIDMGGGTTTIAVFSEGNLVYTSCVPAGGAHVTNDIARGLTTPVGHAERMKILYGNAMTSSADEREMINVPLVGEDDRVQGNQVPKSQLGRIIQPRLEEIFELVRSRLEAGGMAKLAGRRVVLTGGAAQLPGTRELAQQILDKQVRIGKPARVVGLSEATSGPAFATAAGLLIQATRQHHTELPAGSPATAASGNLLGRVGSWLRENL
ncbi:MAG: cell division protein FtsA [Rhodospirillaceae bacterium]